MGSRVKIRNPSIRTTKVKNPENPTTSYVVVPGPRGSGGSGGGGGIVEYFMPVAQTTATFEHGLGYDPTAIQVIVDGVVMDEYTVIFQVPGEVITIGWDVPLKALIRVA